MRRDFKGRSVLSKTLNPASPTTPRGGAFQVLALIAVDGNGNPISFGAGSGGGGGGQVDMTGAVIWKFFQPTMASTWVIHHGMNCYPSVRIVDQLGQDGIPDVTYKGLDDLEVLLARPASGVAYVNRYPAIILMDGAGTTVTPDVNFSNPEAIEVITEGILPLDHPGANDGDINASEG